MILSEPRWSIGELEGLGHIRLDHDADAGKCERGICDSGGVSRWCSALGRELIPQSRGVSSFDGLHFEEKRNVCGRSQMLKHSIEKSDSEIFELNREGHDVGGFAERDRSEFRRGRLRVCAKNRLQRVTMNEFVILD